MTRELLIIEDEEEVASQMSWALSGDYRVELARDRITGLEAFRRIRPDVVILDLGLPPNLDSPAEGLAALAEMLRIDRLTRVIVLTGHEGRQNAIEAVGCGAYDFLYKPANLGELRVQLQRAFHVASLERSYAETQYRLEAVGFEGMLGSSPAMQEAFTAIRKAANGTAPVLITGEGGTGREMAARAIHRQSPAFNGPFVTVDCRTIPADLAEQELFGQDRDASAGAAARRRGLVEAASGGTLLLDEIGALPTGAQGKLLRFLEEGTFQRVGGRQELPGTARIVATTSADLREAVAAGTFLEDLYFRVAVVTIALPPLRDRGGDLHLIAREFLRRYGIANRKPGLFFSPDAIRAIVHHSWPGNIRELQNRVHRAVVMAESRRVTPTELGLPPAPLDTAARTLKSARDSVDRRMVTQALQRHRGRISAAAAELGISRPTLYELMERLGIERG